MGITSRKLIAMTPERKRVRARLVLVGENVPLRRGLFFRQLHFDTRWTQHKILREMYMKLRKRKGSMNRQKGNQVIVKLTDLPRDCLNLIGC